MSITPKEMKDDFISEASEYNYKIIGSFKNEYGEEFILFTKPDSKIIYITGDEFEWNEEYRVAISARDVSDRRKSSLPFTNDLYLNESEEDEVSKLISKVNKT